MLILDIQSFYTSAKKLATAVKEQKPEYVNDDACLCLIVTDSNQVYSGVTSIAFNQDAIEPLRAEKIAIMSVLAAGHAIAKHLILLSLKDFSIQMPDEESMLLLVNSSIDNSGCQIITAEDKKVPAATLVPASQAPDFFSGYDDTADTPLGSPADFANNLQLDASNPFNAQSPIQPGMNNFMVQRPDGTMPPPNVLPQQPGGFQPPQGGFPPQPNGFQPPQGGFQPQQGGFAPQPNGFHPPQGGFQPPQGGFRPPQPGMNGMQFQPGMNNGGQMPFPNPNMNPNAQPMGNGMSVPFQPAGNGMSVPFQPAGNGMSVPFQPAGNGMSVPFQPAGNGMSVPFQPAGNGMSVPFQPAGNGMSVPFQPAGNGMSVPFQPTGNGMSVPFQPGTPDPMGPVSQTTNIFRNRLNQMLDGDDSSTK